MTARIVYATFATARHSGGVQVMGQHVALLREAGYDARIWFPEAAPGWFGDDLPSLTGPTQEIHADDLLVLPEVPLTSGHDPAPGARVAILNQNHFYTFATGPTESASVVPYPGWRRPPDVWAVSGESRDVLAALHPELAVALVPNFVDPGEFGPLPADRPGVAWFPRKRPYEAALLRRLFAHDFRLAGVDLFELVGFSRAEVVETLGRATILVALGHSESFGLPVAEALASGCLVVGYDGGGGHELFEAPGAWRVPEQRPLLLLAAVADLLSRPGQTADLARANRAWVTSRYSADRTATALVVAVQAALARPGATATATHPAAGLHALAPNFTLSG